MTVMTANEGSSRTVAPSRKDASIEETNPLRPRAPDRPDLSAHIFATGAAASSPPYAITQRQPRRGRQRNGREGGADAFSTNLDLAAGRKRYDAGCQTQHWDRTARSRTAGMLRCASNVTGHCDGSGRNAAGSAERSAGPSYLAAPVDRSARCWTPTGTTGLRKRTEPAFAPRGVDPDGGIVALAGRVNDPAPVRTDVALERATGIGRR